MSEYEYKFKEGDRVVIVGDRDRDFEELSNKDIGAEATVIFVDKTEDPKDPDSMPYKVRFDEVEKGNEKELWAWGEDIILLSESIPAKVDSIEDKLNKLLKSHES